MQKTRAIKQSWLVEHLIPEIISRGRLYQKTQRVRARIARGGEQVITITSDGEETRNNASPGDYIVRNESSSGEEYIIPPDQFSGRYVHDYADIYVPGEKARIYALEFSTDFFGSRKIWPFTPSEDGFPSSFFIEARWNEWQVLRDGDFLACPLNQSEVYRIARTEFLETYSAVG